VGNERNDGGAEGEAVMPILSPEVTGIWACACGNAVKFLGTDSWYQRQRVNVLQQGHASGIALLERGTIENGESGAVIGRFVRIECRVCGLTVWRIEHATDSAGDGQGRRQAQEDAVAGIQGAARQRRHEAGEGPNRIAENDLGETFTTGSASGGNRASHRVRTPAALWSRLALDYESLGVGEEGGRPDISDGVRPEADGGHSEAREEREEQVLLQPGETAQGSEPSARGEAGETEGPGIHINLSGFNPETTTQSAEEFQELLRRRLFGEIPWPEE
jgi:hypothetical protein